MEMVAEELALAISNKHEIGKYVRRARRVIIFLAVGAQGGSFINGRMVDANKFNCYNMISNLERTFHS